MTDNTDAADIAHLRELVHYNDDNYKQRFCSLEKAISDANAALKDALAIAAAIATAIIIIVEAI